MPLQVNRASKAVQENLIVVQDDFQGDLQEDQIQHSGKNEKLPFRKS